MFFSSISRAGRFKSKARSAVGLKRGKAEAEGSSSCFTSSGRSLPKFLVYSKLCVVFFWLGFQSARATFLWWFCNFRWLKLKFESPIFALHTLFGFGE